MNLFIFIHLSAVIPAMLIGAYIFFNKKGTDQHKKLGKIWALLMIFGAFVSFGLQKDGQYGWLHVLAVFVIYSVLQGLRSVKLKEVRSHQAHMISAYFASLVAFVFALQPHRLIGQWIDSIFK